MKKFLLVLLSCVALSGFAQTKLVRFGVEGGLNVNKMSFSKELLSSENRCGFFVGPKMYVKIPLVGLGADAAVLYSLNGASAELQDEYGMVVGVDSKNLSYFEIPVNLRYDVSFLKIAGAYVATGPQYNIALNSMDALQDVGMTRRSSWGWNVGAGLKLWDKLQLGVSYTIPISGLNSGTVGEVITNAKQKTVKIRVAYIF